MWFMHPHVFQTWMTYLFCVVYKEGVLKTVGNRAVLITSDKNDL